MFSRDRIRSYTKEGNALYYFFGFCYFLEQDFIVVLKIFYHITRGKVNLIQTDQRAVTWPKCRDYNSFFPGLLAVFFVMILTA